MPSRPPPAIRSSARYLATLTLCRLQATRLPVKTLLDQEMRHHNLPPRERALAMQLVYGVLRRRQNLDRILAILSSTPLARLDPFVHQALAVGLHQLFYLQRIPARAAVSETVECCKAAEGAGRFQGFVNAILRNALRRREELSAASDHDQFGEPILNHPQWLVSRWRHHFGTAEAERICQANNSEPILCLNCNILATTPPELSRLLAEKEIASRPGEYSPHALLLPDFSGSIPSLPGYDSGLFQVQDQAAQLATTLLAPLHAGGRYLDACAGVGGKSCHLHQLAQPLPALVEVVEPDSGRRRLLVENFQRLFPGQPLPTLHPSPLQELCQGLQAAYDGILLDAPCSATGVCGRHPDIRWNRREADLIRYQQNQLALLDHAAGLLRSGGVLVYATCSLEEEENQTVVDRFLSDHPEMARTDAAPWLPPAARPLVTDGFFAPRPAAGIDGFFAARLVRR